MINKSVLVPLAIADLIGCVAAIALFTWIGGYLPGVWFLLGAATVMAIDRIDQFFGSRGSHV